MRASRVLTSFAAFVLFGFSLAWADADSAKGYVKEAEDLIANNQSTYDLEKAKSKLELAETELDGVPDAAKAPVVASIKAAKEKMAAAYIAFDKPKYMRKLTRAMDDAESGIGNLATWGTAEREFNEVYADPAAKIAIAKELEAAAKKFATFKKLNMKKAAVARGEEIKFSMQQLDETWAEKKPEIVDPNESVESKATTIERMMRDINDLRKRIATQLPPDDENAKAFTQRLDKMAGEMTQHANAGEVKEVTDTLKRQIDLYKNDWEGYEEETAGPNWDQFQHKSSAKMDRFLAPKTAIFVMRTDSFLDNLKQFEKYQAIQSDATVKAIIDEVTTKRNAAYAKLLTFVTPVVEEAMKGPVKDSNISNLESNVRLTLGQNSPEGLAMRARLKKKDEDHTAGVAGAEDAKVELIKTLSAKAEAAWPKLYEGMTWISEIDLSKPGALKGKNIGFLSSNLMGYRFQPGDYYFATTIGGIAVAAKFDPLLKKQIAATEKAIGRSLGDDDADGKWDIIAVVTDKKVKLQARKEAETTGNVGGVDVKVRTEYSEPVEAVVIEIIAAKCGPFAGAKDRGVLKVDGTIGK